MYTTEMKIYKAKIGNLYVKSVNLSFGEEISLSVKDRYSRYLNEKEKNFLLECFPNATVKEFSISESEKGW